MPKYGQPVAYGPEWVMRRQQGRYNPIGSKFLQMHQYASSYDFNLLSCDTRFGGVFSLEYSPNGSILVAATEVKALLLYDPSQQKLIKTVPDAQMSCINAVKFLDPNTFATCSDDCTIAIWDIRRMDEKLHHLHGHKNWVKSIEKFDNKLITAGFDGNILAWDFAESLPTPSHKTIFKVNGLMRARISPDGSKLVITTAGGFIIVIHNLDIDTLTDDLKDLSPNLYRLIQKVRSPLHGTLASTEYFKTYGKRNRVEFIADFPDDNDAEVIASLAIFPDGNHILTRNTSHNEVNEYTCVHSIFEMKDDEGEEAEEKRLSDIVHTHKATRASFLIRPNQDNVRPDDDRTLPPNDVWEALVTVQEARISRARLPVLPIRTPPRSAHRRSPRSNANPPAQEAAPSPSRGPNISIRVEFELNETIRRNTYEPSAVLSTALSRMDEDITLNVNVGGANSSSNSLLGHPSGDYAEDEVIMVLEAASKTDTRIHRNKKRFVGYIPEPNTGKGFIKEQAISTDGRFIISPYNNSVRVLALSPSYLEPWQCDATNYPQPLTIVKELNIQAKSRDHVCCAQISPLDRHIVAGTLLGKIAIFNPLRE